MNLFQPDPDYLLHYSSSYNIKRVTNNINVPYYVDKSFMGKLKKNNNFLTKIESEIEDNHIQNLRMNCYNN